MHLIAVVLLGIGLSAVPEEAVPGDGLGLAPPPPAPPSQVTSAPAPSPLTAPLGSEPNSPTAPAIPAIPAVVVAAAAAGVGVRRGGRRWTGPPVAPVPLIVFVPGHGGRREDFAAIAAHFEGTAEIAYFDYSWMDPDEDEVGAARWVSTADAAGALTAFLNGLSVGHSHIYLIGHSKGGAVITTMLAHWDEDPGDAVGAVYGAALLDPPIARGTGGLLQRIGRFIGPVADNGGFNPMKCDLHGCRDVRENLGVAGGVDVVVVRNPDAAVASFGDRPSGLRVLDLVDDGALSAWEELPSLRGLINRSGEAHRSVLFHRAVLDCLAAEVAKPRSCVWTGGRAGPPGKIIRRPLPRP